MTRYHVRFLKKICNDTGHECVTCQGEFLLESASAGQAIEEAETAFCEMHQTDRWDLFADAVEIRIASGRDTFAPRRTAAAQTVPQPALSAAATLARQPSVFTRHGLRRDT